MTALRNVPKLRFPGFSGEWEVKKLGDIYDVRDGTMESPKYVEVGKPLVTSKNLNANGTLDLDNVSLIALSDFESIKRRSGVELGDILFGMIGTIGNPVRVLSNDFAIKNVALIKPRKTPTKYLIQYLNSPVIAKQFYRNNSGGTQQFIGLGDIRSLTICVPNKEEQEKIAGFLTAIDDRIAVIDKKVELLKQYKKGVMQKIFTQQIRFRDENGQDYPAWQEKKLGELEDDKRIKLGRGNVISKTDIAKHPGDYPIYSSSVKNEGLFGRYGKFMFDEELVTWSVDGGGHFFYRPSGKFSVTNVSGWLRIIDSNLNCKFLSLQLQSLHERLIFDYQTKAHPSVIRQLYTIKLPCKEEQQKIADFITSLDDKIRLEETKLTNAKKFKKSLLQSMFV